MRYRELARTSSAFEHLGQSIAAHAHGRNWHTSDELAGAANPVSNMGNKGPAVAPLDSPDVWVDEKETSGAGFRLQPLCTETDIVRACSASLGGC